MVVDLTLMTLSSCIIHSSLCSWLLHCKRNKHHLNRMCIMHDLRSPSTRLTYSKHYVTGHCAVAMFLGMIHFTAWSHPLFLTTLSPYPVVALMTSQLSCVCHCGALPLMAWSYSPRASSLHSWKHYRLLWSTMDIGGSPQYLLVSFDVDTPLKNTIGVGRTLWTATEGGWEH